MTKVRHKNVGYGQRPNFFLCLPCFLPGFSYPQKVELFGIGAEKGSRNRVGPPPYDVKNGFITVFKPEFWNLTPP